MVIAIIALCVRISLGRTIKQQQRQPDGPPSTRQGNYLSTYGVQLRSHQIAKWVTRGFLALTVLLIFNASATIVPTKKVAVVTSFGRTVGTLSNGLHFVAPWEKVTEFDAAIQTDSRTDDDLKDRVCKSTTVRLANQSLGCADSSIRWRIRKDSADELYQDYRDFDKVRDSLVTRQLNAALTRVLAAYDPLSTLASEGKLDANYGELSDRVRAILAGDPEVRDDTGTIGDQIDVQSVLVPLITYDGQTQTKIDLFQAELANTRIALQRQATATNEARANDNLRTSVSDSPNVLVSKCLDTLNDIVKAGQSIPAGFSCWPGGQSSVVVPAVR